MKNFFNSKISTKFEIDQKIERICVITGKYEKLESLIKKKHSISQLKFDGWSPLQSASFNMHIDVVIYLLKNVLVPLDIRDEMGCTALHLATWRGSEQIAQALLNPNPRYEPLTNKKYNHIHFAIFGGHIKMVKSLSKYGRKPFETPNEDGITPFILACKIGRLDIVKYLFTTYKFNIDQTDNYQCTALHHACWEGHPQVIEFLIKNHANTQLLDLKSQKPIDVCQTHEIRDLVLEMMKSYERGDPERMSLIDTAPPPIPQELFSQDHERYIAIIQQLRDFVNSITIVGKGIENIEPKLLINEINIIDNNENNNNVNNNVSRRNSNVQNMFNQNVSASMSLFDEIKSEFDQNYMTGSTNSEEKTESTTPPRRPSIILTSTSSSNDNNAPARSFSLVLSNMIPDLIHVESFESKDDIEDNQIKDSNTIKDSNISNTLTVTSNGNFDNINENNNSNMITTIEDKSDIVHENNVNNLLLTQNESLLEHEKSSSIQTILDDISNTNHIDSSIPSTPPPISSLNFTSNDINITSQSSSSSQSTTTIVTITTNSISSPTNNNNNNNNSNNSNNSKPETPKLTQREILNKINNPIPSDGVQSLVWSICKRTGDITALKSLIQRHPEALHEDIRDSTGSTPLQTAISHEYIDIVKYMLDKGVYINVNDKAGNSPFHLACFTGNVYMIQIFLDYENKLNLWSQNNKGQTVLHIISSLGDLNILKLLSKSKNVPIDTIDNDGYKAIELAEKNNQKQIVDFFIGLSNPPIPSIELENTNKVTSLEQNDTNFLDDVIINENGGYYLGITKRPEYIEQSSLVEDDEIDEENYNDNDNNNVNNVNNNNNKNTKYQNLSKFDSLDFDKNSFIEIEASPRLQESSILFDISPSTSNDLLPGSEMISETSTLTIDDNNHNSHQASFVEIYNGVVFQEVFEDDDENDENDDENDNIDEVEISQDKQKNQNQNLLEINDEKENQKNNKVEIENMYNNKDNNEDNNISIHININENENKSIDKITSTIDNNQLDIFSETFNVNVSDTIILHPIETNDKPVNTENISILSSDELDINNNQQIVVNDTSPSQEENSQKLVNIRWLPLLISVSRIFGVKQGKSLSHYFLHWKYESYFYYHFKQKILHSSTYKYSVKMFIKLIEKYKYKIQILKVWKLWINLPSKISSKLSTSLSPLLLQDKKYDDKVINNEIEGIQDVQIIQEKPDQSLELSINSVNVDNTVTSENKVIIDNEEVKTVETKIEIEENKKEKENQETVELNEIQEAIQEIEIDNNLIKSQNTPNSMKTFPQNIINTPLPDENNSLNMSMISATPPTEGRIAQKLRFNDVVDISIVENLNEPEEEEDLTLLGPLPIDLLPLFKSNEHVLWELLTFYVTNKLSLPSSKTEEKKRITKRIVNSASLWNLLSDFSVCPSVCSKASLKNIIDSLLSPPHLPTIYYSPTNPSPKIKQTDPVVSFLGFQKILWAIARDCLDAPSATDPISRLLSLFSRLDSSPGRKKMASHPRYTHVLPPFILGDSAKRQHHSKEGRKETPPNRRHTISGNSPNSLKQTIASTTILPTSPPISTSPQVLTSTSTPILKSALVSNSPSSSLASSPSTPISIITTTNTNNSNNNNINIDTNNENLISSSKSSSSYKSNKSSTKLHSTITSCITPFGGLGASSIIGKNNVEIETIKKEPEKVQLSNSMNNTSIVQSKNIVETRDSLELSPIYDSEILRDSNPSPPIIVQSNQETTIKNSISISDTNIKDINNIDNVDNNQEDKIILSNSSVTNSLEDVMSKEERSLSSIIIDQVRVRTDSNSSLKEKIISEKNEVVIPNELNVEVIKVDSTPGIEVNIIESPKESITSFPNIILESTLSPKDEKVFENEHKDVQDDENYLDQKNQSKFTINISIDEHVINNPTPTRPGLPPLSPWSSSRQLGKIHYDSDNSITSISPEPTPTPDNTLEELTKVPVADRVNAKLAAKQFEALVTKIKTDSTRGLSPSRERPSPKLAVVVPDYDSTRETTNNTILKTRRSPMPLRRNQSERSYTESIWLNNNSSNNNNNSNNNSNNNNEHSHSENQEVLKLSDESSPSEPPRKPPAPLMRRSSEKSSRDSNWVINNTNNTANTNSNNNGHNNNNNNNNNNKSEISQSDSLPRNEHTSDVSERPKTPNGTLSRREMWGQTLNDEGKLQGALSLWRRSARDFNRSDGEQETNVGGVSNNSINETNVSNNYDADSGNEGSQKNYLSDGEFASDTDYPVTPSPRNRKRRGSLTRRR